MILDRYVVRQVRRPFLLVCLILIMIFAGYSTALFLGQAASGALTRAAVTRLITLKTLIALETLVPVALFLTVVVGLGRMYADREMSAIEACGVGRARILRALLTLFLPVMLAVGGLSIIVRPWAYRESYRLRAKAEEQLDAGGIEAGQFYYSEGTGRVLYADRVVDGTLEDVFLSFAEEDPELDPDAEDRALDDSEEGARLQVAQPGRVLTARRARPVETEAGASSALILEDAQLYDFDGRRLSAMSFGSLEVPLAEAGRQAKSYKRRAMPTSLLAKLPEDEDRAELQWRLTRPLSTFLLGILAVLLSRTDPRKGRYARVFLATAVYGLYYGLSLFARSLLRHGDAPLGLGMWWVDSLLALGLSVALLRSWRASRIAQPLARAA